MTVLRDMIEVKKGCIQNAPREYGVNAIVNAANPTLMGSDSNVDVCNLRNYIRFCSENNYQYSDMILKVVTNIKKKIEEEYENSKACEYFIYGQEEAAVLNYWNMLLENPKDASEQIKIFLHRENMEDYKRNMEHEIVVYRETCADIFMCRYMGMSSFGYLRMAVSIWGRMGGYEEEMYSGLSIAERMKNVLGILLVNENSEIKTNEWMGKKYIC